LKSSPETFSKILSQHHTSKRKKEASFLNFTDGLKVIEFLGNNVISKRFNQSLMYKWKSIVFYYLPAFACHGGDNA